MPPSNHVYTGTIVNKTDYLISILITYELPDKSLYRWTARAPAKGSAPIEGKTRSVGGEDKPGHVVHLGIYAIYGGPRRSPNHAFIKGPFNVTGPTHGYVFTIQRDYSITEQNKRNKEVNADL